MADQKRRDDPQTEPTRDPAVDRMFERDVAAKDWYRRHTERQRREGRKP